MANVPPEIWLQVLQSLRNNDLHSASLVSKDFRYLAQPLLFSVLDVSPFFLSYNADRPVRRPQSYLDRHLERLQVYQRPHLVHGVRHCWISPYSRHGFPERSHLDDLDPCLVINPLINALHNFPNLHKLSWHCIDITPEWWMEIQALSLRKLWINSSLAPILDSNVDDPNESGAGVVISPLSSITHLDLDQWPWEGQITNHVSIHEERAHGMDLPTLRLIIHPESTHSISVPRVDTACRLLTALSSFPHHLQTLRIPFRSLSSPDFVLALEQCGFLETLSILPPSADDRTTMSRTLRLPEIPTHVVPNLRAYEGPCINVLDFATTRALERLSLWGFDQLPIRCDSFGPMMPLSETLRMLKTHTPCSESLKSLQVVVMCVDRTLMDGIAGLGNLEDVFVQSQDANSSSGGGPPIRRMHSSGHILGSNMPISHLYALLLSTTFPASLKRLKLDTRLSSSKLALEDQETDAVQFMESFAARNPSLKKVELAYGVYWTGIYTAVWGRLRGNDRFGESMRMREKNRAKEREREKAKTLDDSLLGGFNGYEVASHGSPSWPPGSKCSAPPPHAGPSTLDHPVCGKTDLLSPSSPPSHSPSLSSSPAVSPNPSSQPQPESQSHQRTPLSRAPTEPDTPTQIAQEALTGYSTSKSSSRHNCLMSTVVSSVCPGRLGRLVFTVHRRTILLSPPGGSSAGVGAGIGTGAGGTVDSVNDGSEGTEQRGSPAAPKAVRRSESRVSLFFGGGWRSGGGHQHQPGGLRERRSFFGLGGHASTPHTMSGYVHGNRHQQYEWIGGAGHGHGERDEGAGTGVGYLGSFWGRVKRMFGVLH